jgi:3-hydroxyacyl-CoA dehydrogenase
MEHTMGIFIRQATVIGAGTMGSGIAVHLANAGLDVLLLDIIPSSLTPEEEAKGLTLAQPEVRNRIVTEGLRRVRSSRAPNFFTPRTADRVKVGNLEDDFHRVAEADWVIEAIVEDLPTKQDLMRRIEKTRRPGSLVSTNTSGLPLEQIGAGLSEEFLHHFLGTHFFNPPRQMKLLEIIPGPQTGPEVMRFMTRFVEEVLGKGVVRCKDTPNFIANRIAGIQGAFEMDHVVSHGYTVEEADAILGPAIGRPSTAIFRLRDLVGLDVSTRVSENLYNAIAEDKFREILVRPAGLGLRRAMVERGWLGRKSGQGFYKEVEAKGGRQFWALDLQRLEYREPQKPELPTLRIANEIHSIGERLRFLVAQQDRVGRLVWACMSNLLAYAAYAVPEISDDLSAIDRAMQWGYAWELGPFEIWDELGVAETVARMQADGIEVNGWVLEMLARGYSSFYGGDRAREEHYDLATKRMVAVPDNARRLSLAKVKAKPGRVIRDNPGASLVDLGDGVACLEFHTKVNALDDTVLEMMEAASDELERDFLGLVIGNEGRHFSAGANLHRLLERAADRRFSEIENAIQCSQDRRMAFRYSPKPVVVACFGSALGGGAETVLCASRVCAAAESNIGLVETGIGLIPAAGGCKEMLRRVVSPPMLVPKVEPLPFVSKVFDAIRMGKTSGSAEEAREIGFLSEADRVVMNRDYLLAQAKRMVLDMAAGGYRPPAHDKSIFAMGRRGIASLEVTLDQLERAGGTLTYDVVIGRKLASVLCGGDLASPQWVEEQYILDLEREAFVSLAGELRTQDRIRHFLATGERLRN